MNKFTTAKRSLSYDKSPYYEEVYGKFMDQYDAGENPAYITSMLRDEYHSGTRDTEYLLHDVYFALACANWETGCLPDWLLRIVGDIITSGADLEYFQKKGFPAESIKRRDAELRELLCRLMLPCDKPRKRKERGVRPEFRIGDVFAFEDDGGTRLLIIADHVDTLPFKPMYFCCIPDEYYDDGFPGREELADTELKMFGLLMPSAEPSPQELEYVMHINIPPGRYVELFGKDFMTLDKKYIYGDERVDCSCTLNGFIRCTPDEAKEYIPLRVRYLVKEAEEEEFSIWPGPEGTGADDGFFEEFPTGGMRRPLGFDLTEYGDRSFLRDVLEDYDGTVVPKGRAGRAEDGGKGHGKGDFKDEFADEFGDDYDDDFDDL